MCKILLFTSAYKSSGSANGICARNLVKEFVRQDHEVFVIATPFGDEKGMEEIDGAKVWFEPFELYDRIFKYLLKHHSNALMKMVFKFYNILRILIFGPLYPNDCRFRVRRLKKRATGLIDRYGIDVVIGTCMPYDGIPTAIFLKRKYGDSVHVVTYHLDLMSLPNNTSKWMSAFKKWKYRKAFAEELSVVDHVFLPKTAEGLYNNIKISIVGFPVYVKDGIHKESSFVYPKGVTNVAYVGSLDSRNRSPKHAIGYIQELNKISESTFKLHIWGNLADEETRSVVENAGGCVSYHGMVENSEVYSLMMKADYLLNISNAVLYKLIPSKIFSMFATGKPIINIVSHPDDCTIPFFIQYGNAKSIKVFDQTDNNIYQIELKSHIDVPENLFEEFSPSFIAGQILS